MSTYSLLGLTIIFIVFIYQIQTEGRLYFGLPIGPRAPCRGRPDQSPPPPEPLLPGVGAPRSKATSVQSEISRFGSARDSAE
eukprot:7397331-Heterocapsa_arctica.AAC.1